MQKKFVFKKKVLNEYAENEKAVLTYTPSDMDAKNIEIKVNDMDLAEQLGLPTENFNDSIIIEFGAKEIQSKLILHEESEDDKTDVEISVEKKVVKKKAKKKISDFEEDKVE